MASPVRKRVTDEVMQRLGDAVARAFRRDAAENSRWNLTARFAALTDPEARTSKPARTAGPRAAAQASRENAMIVELEATLDRYAIAILAHHLELAELSPSGGNVVSLGRNRIRRWPTATPNGFESLAAHW